MDFIVNHIIVVLVKRYLNVGVDDWLTECAIIASNGYDLQCS